MSDTALAFFDGGRREAALGGVVKRVSRRAKKNNQRLAGRSKIRRGEYGRPTFPEFSEFPASGRRDRPELGEIGQKKVAETQHSSSSVFIGANPSSFEFILLHPR